MTDEPDEPMQETPGGAEIPVPSKVDVFRDLEKIAKPRRGDGQSDPPTPEDLD